MFHAIAVEQLQGSQPATLLCDKARPSILSGSAGVVELTIDGSLYESLNAYCRRLQLTPFTVLLAAFRAVHYRLTGTEDATIRLRNIQSKDHIEFLEERTGVSDESTEVSDESSAISYESSEISTSLQSYLKRAQC